ncbi:MAG: peptide chain release factor N(5)-glutamine methyltransferase [Lachnospiraceae bacterium]|nr:peptide chain release factor N(5)-glutamine methyltransferase [Lachnospiraceae bacterium]
MKKTYRQCYAWGQEVLAGAGIADARIDARLLLEYIFHTSQHDLILHGDRLVTEAEQADYEDCILKRSMRIPLQHITGEQAFMGFDFQVNEHVLIPRQDTEILVETALGILKPGMRVLDMCTGSGCILLSLLALAGGCTGCAESAKAAVTGIGVDISAEALKVARRNLEYVSVQCGRRLEAEFVESDLFTAFTNHKVCFDIIVSNPPYIASEVIKTLEPEVRLHEPLSALDGTADGLYFYRHIVAESKSFLKKGGALLFEIGHDQGESVAELMKEAGFTFVAVKKDYAGLDRVVYGIYEEEA